MALPKHPTIQTRFLVCLICGVALTVISKYLFGTFFPEDSQDGLIVQGGLLLIILGSFLLEDKFTKPADTVMNSLAGFISLYTVYNSKPEFWIWIESYCIFVFLLGTVCILIGVPNEKSDTGILITISKVFYRFATLFGSARVLFSIIFLAAVISHYGLYTEKGAFLILIWAIYITLWPLKIPHVVQYLINALKRKQAQQQECGIVLRSDSPDILKIEFDIDKDIESNLMIACLGDSKHSIIKPLFKELQDCRVVTTCLVISVGISALRKVPAGHVYLSDKPTHEFDPSIFRYSDNERERMIGIVCEESNISLVRFKTWRHEDCEEGFLVYCKIKERIVYYQITDAATKEEGFEAHKHGYQIVDALQVGVLDENKGFKKFPWLPEMNTPIFLADKGITLKQNTHPGDFSLGVIPGTGIDIIANINDIVLYHTALLGVTGTGKTQFGFDIIQKAVEAKIKVICIDITGDYIDKLTHLSPEVHEVAEKESTSLENAFKKETTGKFNPDVQKEVEAAKKAIYQSLKANIETFFQSDKDLCVLNLPYIYNTKSAIYIMGLYLTLVFDYARSKRGQYKVLLVLEEAHTIIPEAHTMGVNDNDAKSMVGRIAQIALQGRKYGVGLLVIAQRTATVSKTVLTQCNTIITFSTYDQTGIEYLSNFYGSYYAKQVPNLQFLEAIAWGKAVKTERPVLIGIPFKQSSPLSISFNASYQPNP